MVDIDNTFGAIKCLADSNSNWIRTSQDLIVDLTKAIQEHLDNVELVMKNVEKSDCDISDLQNIYSIRLDVYEAIVDLMTKINEVSTKEIEIQKKMYNEEFQKYKDIFEVLKHTDSNSQI